jgi:hypothetical protein
METKKEISFTKEQSIEFMSIIREGKPSMKLTAANRPLFEAAYRVAKRNNLQLSSGFGWRDKEVGGCLIDIQSKSIRIVRGLPGGMMAELQRGNVAAKKQRHMDESA